MTRNLWWVVLVLSFPGCLCSSLGTPKAFSNEPEGGPCNSASECASGLSCFGYQVDPAGTVWEGGNLCTVGCSATACPTGTACVQPDSRVAPTGPICVPVCQTSVDCELGGRAMTCVLDGGSGLCEALNCVEGDSACPKPNCGACPSGFSCVASPGSYGFCQK